MTANLQVNPGQNTPLTPKHIEDQGHARDSLVRVIFGGSILGIFSVGAIVMMAMRVEGARELISVVGIGLGFLLGQGRSRERSA